MIIIISRSLGYLNLIYKSTEPRYKLPVDNILYNSEINAMNFIFVRNCDTGYKKNLTKMLVSRNYLRTTVIPTIRSCELSNFQLL